MNYQVVSPGAVTEEFWQEKTVRVLSGGFNVALSSFPTGLAYLKKGTPLLVDFATRNAIPVKTAAVTNTVASDAVVVPVAKNSHFKVGDPIGTPTKSVTITAIDTSNAGYDVLTVSAAIGALTNTSVLGLSTEAGSNKALVMPNALAYADVRLEGQPAVSAIYQAHEVKLSKLPFPLTAAMQTALTSRFLFVP